MSARRSTLTTNSTRRIAESTPKLVQCDAVRSRTHSTDTFAIRAVDNRCANRFAYIIKMNIYSQIISYLPFVVSRAIASTVHSDAFSRLCTFSTIIGCDCRHRCWNCSNARVSSTSDIRSRRRLHKYFALSLIDDDCSSICAQMQS